LQALVLGFDRKRLRFKLCTKYLEAEEGDMLRDPQLVYDNAEQGAAFFRACMAGQQTPQEHTGQEGILNECFE
jgi:small subunit ribosomal protein S1